MRLSIFDAAAAGDNRENRVLTEDHVKIGIIGTGNMGRVLGSQWASAGHQVFFGARRPDAAKEAEELAREQKAAEVYAGSNREAAAFGDALLYCLRDIDPVTVFGDVSSLSGKILIDLNNKSIPPGFQFEPRTGSFAETLQNQVPNAIVVKAFNTLAQEVFEVERAELQRRAVTTLIATNDVNARAAVETLARDLGLTPINAGPLRNARLLESAGDLIRYLIGGAGLGPLATLSVVVLQANVASRFGGRRKSTLDDEEMQRPMSGGNRVEVESSGVIDAPIEDLWRLVSDFNNVARWHPDVTECRLEFGSGREAGSVRAVRLRNGMSIREQLLAISGQDYFYKYSVIESPLPIRDHESTVHFMSLNKLQTQVNWAAQFVVIDGDTQALASGVKGGVLDLGIEGLRQAVSRSSPAHAANVSPKP